MPRSITTTPAQLERAIKMAVASQARALEEAGRRAVYVAAQEGRAEAVRELGRAKPRPPVDTRELRRGYRVRMERAGRGRWRAVLENIASHAPHMEFGTRPHWAPIAPLIRWAERKLRGDMSPASPTKKAKPPAGTRRRKGTRPSRVEIDISGWSKAAKGRFDAARAIAFRVRAKIAKEGLEARNWHAKASKRFPAFMQAALIAELRKVR